MQPTLDDEIQLVKAEITRKGLRYEAVKDDPKKQRETRREIEIMRAILARLLAVQRGEQFRRDGV
jgi:hypothetical protein